MKSNIFTNHNSQPAAQSSRLIKFRTWLKVNNIYFCQAVIIFFIFTLNALSDDLIYPKFIDGGNIPVVSDTNNKLLEVFKYCNFSITNISDEPVYIISSAYKLLYDKSISKHSSGGNNIAAFGAGRYLLNKNETTSGNVLFHLCYIDSVSSSGNYLKAMGTIYYKKFSAMDIDSILINIQFRAIDSNKAVLIGQKNSVVAIYYKYSFGAINKMTTNTLGKLYNFSNDSFIVDSCKTEVIGNNPVQPFYQNSYADSIAFPYELAPNSSIYIRDSIKYLFPEKTRIPFTIFGHYKQSGKTEILKDTSYDFTQLYSGLNVDYYSNLIGYINKGTHDSAIFSRITVWNYTDTVWNLTKFSYKADQPELITANPDSLPQMILCPDSMGRPRTLYYNGHGDYYVRDTGRYRVFIELEFTDTFGNIKKHNILQIIYGFQQKTDVPDKPDFNSNFLVYPNPASGKIFINSNFSENNPVQVEIYNLLGIKLYENKLSGSNQNQFQIDISGWEPGVYYAVMKSGNITNIKKFIIAR